MSYSYDLFRRMSRLRVPLLTAVVIALGGCDGTNSLDPDAGGNAGAQLGDEGLTMDEPIALGSDDIADSLDAVIADYGITLHSSSEVTSVDTASQKVGITSVVPGGADTMLPYDVLHAVPRQSAPDWIKSSPLSTDDPTGYVEIDKSFLNLKPLTRIRMTRAGRAAFAAYLEALNKLVGRKP